VIDPRQLATEAVIERLLESFERREQTEQVLSTTIDGVKASAADQFSRITEMLEGLA
jgi:hypothetical protein